MYLAQKESDRFNVYQTFLDEAIKTGNSYYKSLFEEILSISKRLISQEIDFYKVNSELYEVVSFLVREHPEYINEVNVDTLTTKNLMELKSFFEKQKEESLISASWTTV